MIETQPTLRIVEGEPSKGTRPLYLKSDYSLKCEVEELTRPTSSAVAASIAAVVGLPTESRRRFVSADTLTLIFDERDGHLLGLDAYTNAAKWAPWRAEYDARSKGRLIATEFPDDDEHHSITSVPIYAYDAGSHALRITLSPKKPASFVRVGEHLVIGVAESVVSQLILENVQILDCGD